MVRPRKPPDQRQHRGTKNLDDMPHLDIVPAEDRPAPMASWLSPTKREWIELWDSPLAGHIQSTDVDAYYRCFGYRDEMMRHRRAAAAMRKRALAEPLVETEKGPAGNPLFDVANALDKTVIAIESKACALEDRLGLTPKARLNIGISMERGRSLAAQNAILAEAIKGAMSDSYDPRALPRDSAIDTG
jgi:hypothetical protein